MNWLQEIKTLNKIDITIILLHVLYVKVIFSTLRYSKIFLQMYGFFLFFKADTTHFKRWHELYSTIFDPLYRQGIYSLDMIHVYAISVHE